MTPNTFTLYRLNHRFSDGRTAKSEWRVGEPPGEILGYPPETIVVVPVERVEQAFNEGRREGQISVGGE